MAPVRKRRNVNKEGAEQDEQVITDKNLPRKRKCSDMLGSQWSKKELENFYKAYCKHGMDWKKVASAVHGRTAEMVAALYKLNRAYLSLPDQIGSLAGFIAMMIDHYNILDTSNSDRDSTEDHKRSNSPKQQTGLKNALSNTNNLDSHYSGLMHTRPVPVFGSSPPRKKRTGGRRSRVVGKGAPRFSFSYIMENKSETEPFFIDELGMGFNGDFNGIEFVKSADLTLIEASLQETAPQVPGIANQRTRHIEYSSVQNASSKVSSACNELGGSGCNDSASARVDFSLKGIEGSEKALKKVLAKSRRSALTGKAEGKSIYSIKGRIKKTDINLLRLEGSEHAPKYAIEQHTETGEVIGSKAGINNLIDTVPIDKMEKKALSQQPRNRSRKLLSGDTQLQFQEEKTEYVRLEENAKASAEVFIDAIIRREKADILLEHERVSHGQSALTSVELAVTEIDHGTHATLIAESKKCRRKMGAEKDDQVEAIGEPCSGVTEKAQTQITFQVEKHSRKKLKQVTNTNELPRRSEPVKNVEACTSDGCTIDYLNQTTAVCEATLSNEYYHRQNVTMDEASLEKADKVSNYYSSIAVNPHPGPAKIAARLCADSMMEGLPITKAHLMHCLLSAKLRHWCLYEWFYSAIDLPWFERNEFVEYLNHAGLGRVLRLTRIEWGVIRSSLGKPRRLSARFLQEEREKLDQYRKSVRKIHNDIHAGVCNVFPADLALSFSAGQQVLVCHPKTREIHSGIILSVDQNRYSVQFHRDELGVESVLDIDCMPKIQVENMPATLRRKIGMWAGSCQKYGDKKLGMKSNTVWSINSDGMTSLEENMDVHDVVPAFATPSHFSGFLSNHPKAAIMGSVKQTKFLQSEQLAAPQHSIYNQPSTLMQVQDLETDKKALCCLNCALDKKEALLMELKHLNDDLSISERHREILRNTMAFRKHYAHILMQLKIVNEQIISALKFLRKWNAYQENMVPPWHHVSSDSCGVEDSSTFRRVGSISIGTSLKVMEIVTNAKRKARLMVNIAMQVILSLRDDEDVIVKLGVALDTVCGFHVGLHSGRMKIKLCSSYLDSIRDAAEREKLSSHQSFGPELIASDASQEKNELSNEKEGLLLSEIAASCVSALILIQTCSDSKLLPSEVTHLLDDAVRSMQPCSTSNLMIYMEIQQCMNIVRNQILTLMPTQPSISITAEISSGT